MAGELQHFYGRFAKLQVKETVSEITGPTRLIDAVLELGKKGVAIQRYKGLGEMNREQLWETTLDPERATCCRSRSATAKRPTACSPP